MTSTERHMEVRNVRHIDGTTDKIPTRHDISRTQFSDVRMTSIFDVLLKGQIQRVSDQPKYDGISVSEKDVNMT